MSTGGVIVDECLPMAPTAAGAPAITVRVGSTLAEIERQVTLATLEHLGRHKEKTAATLGISLKTLYNRLKEYAAEDGEPLPEPGTLDAGFDAFFVKPLNAAGLANLLRSYPGTVAA